MKKLLVVLVLLLISSWLFSQAPPVPDSTGMIYAIDGNGTSLTRLEKGTFFVKRRIHGVLSNKTVMAQLDGEHSPVHLSQAGDKPMEFIIREPSGADPTKIVLYGLDVKDGHRIVTVSELSNQVIRSKAKSGEHVFEFDLKEVSTNVYRLVPVAKLPPGEYVFSRLDANDGFCFSIE